MKKLIIFLGIFYSIATMAYDWRDDLPIRPRNKKAPRTYVLSQTQLIYGLAPYGGYYHWNDRPLLLDPELRPVPSSGRYGHDPQYPDFYKMSGVARSYGLDGFVFFMDNYPRRDYAQKILDYSKRADIPGFSVMPTLSRNKNIEKNLKLIADSSSLFILNGKKVVLFRYDTDKNKNLLEIQKAARKKYGDQFIFLKEVNSNCGRGVWQFKYRSGNISKEDIRVLKEHYRKHLRLADGIIVNGLWVLDLNKGYRVQYTKFYRDFLLRVVKSVISEPEFKDKYLMLTARVAHENTFRLGYSIGGDGTKTFREGSIESGLEIDPDFILQLEWDEENENTCMRPTVCRSFAFKRIMHYYMTSIKKAPASPLPGDDLSIPNLVISTRKILTLGERLGIELLNIPDSSGKFTYTVKARLKNLAGKVVHEFPEVRFDASRMYDHTLYIPSEKFNLEPALTTCFEISYKDKTKIYEAGLPSIILRPLGNNDYMWINQPLRDLLEAKVDFKHKGNIFNADVNSKGILNYVEILDNDNCVYSFSKVPVNTRENNNNFVFQVLLNSISLSRFTGKISVENAQAQTLVLDRMWRSNAPKSLRFKNYGTYIYNSPIFISVSKKDLDRAIVKVETEGSTFKLKLSELQEKQIIGFNHAGISIVFARSLQQWEHPKHINSGKVKFEAEILPEMNNSVIQLLLIGKDGRTWRSKPVCMEKKSSKMVEIIVFSETQDKAVRVLVDANRIPDLKYDFSKSHGTVISCPEGRLYWGILGAFTEQSTLRGIGYGNQLAKENEYRSGKAITNSVPCQTEDKGEPVLCFNGNGSHVSFPALLIPRCAGYRISFDIFPEKAKGRECLLTTRMAGRGPSSLEIFMDNGVLKSTYSTDHTEVYAANKYFKANSNLHVPLNKWSKVTIDYDLENIVFGLNGRKSRPIPCRGPGRFDTGVILGGWQKEWFKGKIKNFSVNYIW